MIKRVLEITGEPIANGGQEMFIINMLNAIDKEGINIDWLTPYCCSNFQYKRIVEENGGNVFCFNQKFLLGCERFKMIKPLNDFLKSHNYDVVHIHSGSTMVLMIVSIIARINNVPKIIVHSHSGGYKKTIGYYLLKLVSYYVFKLFPTDYFACSEVAARWKFANSIINDKLQIIKNGVDLMKFLPDEGIRKKYRTKLSISSDTIVLGHVGRFSYQKNQEFLVNILLILRERNVKTNLLLIGEGEDYQYIYDLVEKKGLKHYVSFIGTCANVSDYMQAMDVFVLPSRWEGLPIVGIEAQAAGLPIVASDLVTKEMKISDKVGYLPLGCIDDWVKMIIDYSTEPKRNNIEIMKSSGYDINLTAAKIRKIYLEE